MVGHGSPKASRAPTARLVRATSRVYRAALIGLLACLAAAQLTAAETDLELRFAWGGGAERVWQGSIRLTDGHFVAALGLSTSAHIFDRERDALAQTVLHVARGARQAVPSRPLPKRRLTRRPLLSPVA